MKRYKYFNGKRYSLDAVRGNKSDAKNRADNMKRFWKHRRVLKSGNDYLIYVHGKK